MVIPYGEWILFILTLAAWAEKNPLRRLLFSLSLAWITGKIIEGMVGQGWTWHLEFSRFAVIIVFFIWAWRRSSPNLLSFVVPSVILMVEELLLTNEPGIVPTENWFFAGALFLTAWLTSQSYWGMAASVTGSLLISQFFNFFAFGGLIRHKDLPDPFLWHIGVAGLAVFALVHQVYSYWKTNHPRVSTASFKDEEQLTSVEIDINE